MRDNLASGSPAGKDLLQGPIGVVGLGRMGAGIAGRLASQGLDVLGYDLDSDKMRDAPFSVTDDPTEIGRHSRTVLFSLPRAEHLQPAIGSIAGGDILNLEPGLCLIDMGTSLPAVQQDVARMLGERGIDFLDAPVSGGPSAANDGTLLIMVGGSATAVERARPVLELAGRVVLHIGPIGSGTVVKLLNNGILAAAVLAAGEAVTLASHHGIEPADLLTALSAGSARGYAVDEVIRRHVSGEVTQPRFTFEQLLKDVNYLDTAFRGDFHESSVFPATVSALSDVVARGHGSIDFGATAPWGRDRH